MFQSDPLLFLGAPGSFVFGVTLYPIVLTVPDPGVTCVCPSRFRSLDNKDTPSLDRSGLDSTSRVTGGARHFLVCVKFCLVNLLRRGPLDRKCPVKLSVTVPVSQYKILWTENNWVFYLSPCYSCSKLL